ncbi:AAA family ATPase [Paraburkholderia sediminicola]|uniref:AAA family ATPase n=1 Tax=Paraburkholderia sediminicola TaxID=458836 RepID=UPI0038B8BAF9
MHISRIQIEEGFLNGFDLRPSPGLNVLIGARGTGKTSVIELIRYALAAKSHTVASESRSLDHAKAVLDGGEVSVHVSGAHGEVVVTRAADDDAPRANGDFVAPIVLSQMEIETLGLSEGGRLSLIDGFIRDRGALKAEEAATIGSIRSIFKEITSLELEIATLVEGKPQLEPLMSQLTELRKQQVLIQGQSKLIGEKQTVLARYSSMLARLSVRAEVLSRFEDAASQWKNALEGLVDDDFGPEAWDDESAPDPLEGLRDRYRTAQKAAARVAAEFSSIADLTAERREQALGERVHEEKLARSLRAELDKLVEGSGALERQIAGVQTQVAQMQAREKVSSERKRRLVMLRQKRDGLLDELQAIRDRRYESRATTIASLNKALGPHIKIELERSAQYHEYTKAITNALRGSGMKYAELAVTLSQRLSPRELIQATDQSNFSFVADAADLPKERAARLIGHLKEFGCVEVATADVEDNVRMSLLDGVAFKDITALSAGQRCTVVLSIVLQHRERTLVIDQPEDHLDNAFVATTVIKALRERKGGGQVILSTHNANIPVLGEADLIVEMTSDGRNGFLQLCRPLDHPDAVEAITTVMEGGRDAFAKRAKFYADHDL